MLLEWMDAARARAAATEVARRLAADPRVELVYLFGSATDDDVRRVRDVDIAVLARPRLSFEELLRMRADLVVTTGAPIDLVPLDAAGVVLAHEIAQHGRCLYARVPDAAQEFVARARMRFLDWRPFRDEQWRAAGERAAERRGGAQG
jgi:predicted nucleotidyltransferase